MTTWTYDHRCAAWLGDEIVTVPDEIDIDQRTHDREGTVFPAIAYQGTVYVRLDGDAYGLHTGGTGDMVVRRPTRKGAMRLFVADADAGTGETIDRPEEIGETTEAEFFGRDDTDTVHYDTFEHQGETCAVIVTLVG
jgi:hypothetical protein